MSVQNVQASKQERILFSKASKQKQSANDLDKKKKDDVKKLTLALVGLAAIGVAAVAILKNRHVSSAKITDAIDSCADDLNSGCVRGVFGQDLGDVTNPLNRMDMSSPFYESNGGVIRGIYGQDLGDMLDPLNKMDMSSPYYDPSAFM